MTTTRLLTILAARGATLLLALSLFCTCMQASASAQSVGWIQRTESGPSPRLKHAMAYDSARGVTVLFGGRDSFGALKYGCTRWRGDMGVERNRVDQLRN